MKLNKIYNENCLTGLSKLPDNSIDCCVTSPPYFGLRDYGNDKQLGQEETPDEFVKNLVEILSEVKRCLKPDGTLWLNLGDSYAGSGKGNTGHNGIGNQEKRQGLHSPKISIPCGLKSKDLIGIPWMVAFALRADGWYLRQDIIWSKPNPMPESVTDRCTKSHEYIFLLSKSAKYYYDHESIKTDVAQSSITRLSQDIENQNGSDRVQGKTNGKMKAVGGKKHKNLQDKGQQTHSFHRTRNEGGEEFETDKANKRSVWTVSTKPFTGAHFATFPQDLIFDCIKAGCPENGIVLDPFMGAGTTAVVSRKLNRNYIGFELNQDYIEIANKRLFNEIGLFL